MLSEDQALRIVTRHLKTTYAESARKLVRLGIGDDAAAVSLSGLTVITTDACNEGSHFLRAWVSPRDLAHKSFHSAVSDVSAMGGRPTVAVCHLTLPDWMNARSFEAFVEQQARVAKETKTAIVGGNISFGESLQIVTTVLGSSAVPPIPQGGAAPGEEVWLLGEVGLARAGLLLLQGGILRSRNRHAVRCLTAFRRPQAQLAGGPRLCGRATSCIDVSDGLERDARRLADQSGTRVVLSEERLIAVLDPALFQVAPRVEEEALELALRGGEDYALLATGPREKRPRGVVQVGWVERGKGLVLAARGGHRQRR